MSDRHLTHTLVCESPDRFVVGACMDCDELVAGLLGVVIFRDGDTLVLAVGVSYLNTFHHIGRVPVSLIPGGASVA